MNATVVQFYRFEGKAGTVGFFDIVLDRTLVLKGATLRQSKDGDYYWKPPAKPRLKNGQAVKDEKGFAVWDDHYRLFVGDDKKLTKEANAFNQDVLSQAVAEYEGTAKRETGRGKKKAAAVATKTDDANDEDEDLPF